MIGKFKLFLFTYTTISLGGLNLANADRIIVSPKSIVPKLGRGFSTTKETFENKTICASGNIEQRGAPSSIGPVQQVDESRVSSELGFEGSLRAKVGLYNIDAAADFLKNSKSTSYSLTQVYMSEYTFKNHTFGNDLILDPQVRRFINNKEKFLLNCGDKFISQEEYGAKFFLSIRIDFSSKEEKEKFSSSFHLDSTLINADAKFASDLQNFSKNATVKVNVYQIGGSPAKLRKIFTNLSNGTNENGVGAFIDCSNGQIARCTIVLKNALNYAVDTQEGFPSQITKDPALIAYYVEDYTRIPNIPHWNEQIEAATQLSRSNLSKIFDFNINLFNQLLAIKNNKAIPLSVRQSEMLTHLEGKLNSNVNQLIGATQTCYMNPAHCSNVVRLLTGTLTQEAIHEVKARKAPDEDLNFYDILKHLDKVSEDDLVDVSKPETFRQYCMIGKNKGDSNDPLAVTIKSMISLAKSLNSAAFLEVSVSNQNECDIAEQVLNQQKKLDFRKRTINSDNKDTTYQFIDMRPVSMLTHPAELNLAGNDINDVSALRSLKNLKSLTLSKNKLINIDALADLTELEYLDVRENRLGSVATLRALQNIKLLDISGNDLVKLECPFEDASKCINIAYEKSCTFCPIENPLCAMYDTPRVAKISEHEVFIYGGTMRGQESIPIGVFSSLTGKTEKIHAGLKNNCSACVIVNRS